MGKVRIDTRPLAIDLRARFIILYIATSYHPLSSVSEVQTIFENPFVKIIPNIIKQKYRHFREGWKIFVDPKDFRNLAFRPHLVWSKGNLRSTPNDCFLFLLLCPMFEYSSVEILECTCIPDSGAAVSILPIGLLPPQAVVKPTAVTVKAYGGFPLPVIGSCLIPVEHRGQKRDVLFVVIDLLKEPPLLSLETCKELDRLQPFVAVSIQQKSVVNDFPEVFHGTGCISSFKYIIRVNTDVLPKYIPPDAYLHYGIKL